MSKALDVIAGRYTNARGRIEVPELGSSNDQPLVIFHKPYTLHDDRSMARYAKEDSPDGFAHIIVAKAEDEAGNKLFDPEDKPKLIRIAPALVLKRVAMQIIASVSPGDAEKN